jgi:hypothetical protein
MTINGSKIDLKIALYYSQNSIIMTCILAFKDKFLKVFFKKSDPPKNGTECWGVLRQLASVGAG